MTYFWFSVRADSDTEGLREMSVEGERGWKGTFPFQARSLGSVLTDTCIWKDHNELTEGRQKEGSKVGE